MKYVMQLMIIFGVSMVGEFLNKILPLPVPASVYGLVIMFLLLVTKIVKVEQVEDVSKYLMAIMPLFFIEPSVGLMNSFEAIKGNVIALCLASFLSFVAVMVVTGLSAQFIIRKKK
ncbi:MAG: CidA/LrgA family protein [Eubacteriales bacterium]